MGSVNKFIVFSPSHQSCRGISLSAWFLRRKPTPQRDMSKRNFQGEKLEEYMRKRAESIQAQQPYKNALADVIERFKIELKEIERLKHDTQGEMMKREVAEREQAVKNLTIIAKNNEDLRRQRELQKLIDEDEEKRIKEEKKEQLRLEMEARRKRHTDFVLNIIEESEEFITMENMDEKIEYLLDNEVNFNYAITPDGEKILSTKPPGNLDGWKGPSQSALVAGGIDVGSAQWNYIFEDRETGFTPKQTSFRSRKVIRNESSDKQIKVDQDGNL